MDLSHIRSNKRKVFVEEFVETGDAVKAARAAGYDKGDQRKLRSHAWNLKSQLKEEIEGLTREKLKGVGPKALNVMENLLERGESETVRFQAAKDLLDRSGYRGVEVESEVKRTVEEMEAQLVALVGTDGAKVLLAKIQVRKPVSDQIEEIQVVN